MYEHLLCQYQDTGDKEAKKRFLLISFNWKCNISIHSKLFHSTFFSLTTNHFTTKLDMNLNDNT